MNALFYKDCRALLVDGKICSMCVLEERHVGRQKTHLIGKDVTPLVVKRPSNIIIIAQHIQSSSSKAAEGDLP